MSEQTKPKWVLILDDYAQAKLDYYFMLAFVFGRPYEEIMEDQQYQKDNFIRRSVMDRLREMKQKVESLKKEFDKIKSE